MFLAVTLPALLVTTLQASPVSTYFSPPPGSEVRVADSDLAKASTGVQAGQLRGFIEVNPPKGKCLAVFRGEKSGAEHICKKTTLSFRLSEIDRAGVIRWEVKTTTVDPGTILSWRTPYRLAMVIARERGKSHPKADSEDYWRSLPPDYKYIQRCNDISEGGRRKLEVKLFSGESWRFTFPDRHVLLPQPESLPNLYISASGQKRGLPDGKPADESAPKAEEQKPAEPSEEQAPEPPSDAPKKKVDKPSNTEDRKSWTVPLRGSYGMSADNFHPDSSQTPGTRGLCRYNFRGPENDPETGRMECQDTPYFHMVLLPMTCLAAVKGDKDPSSTP